MEDEIERIKDLLLQMSAQMEAHRLATSFLLAWDPSAAEISGHLVRYGQLAASELAKGTPDSPWSERQSEAFMNEIDQITEQHLSAIAWAARQREQPPGSSEPS